MVQDGLVPADLLQDDGFEPDDEMPADKSTSLQQPAVAETVVLQSSTPIEESVAVVATEAQSSAVEEVAVTEANVAVVAGESAEAVIAD
jgi:hypothetical protein